MLGTLTELLVEAEILAGSDGRLIPSRVEPDVDHRDIIVAELGGFGALWLQVKGMAHLDSRGQLCANARFPIGAIPESDRLYYVVCVLDLKEHQLARLWLLPSADFNRLAYRDLNSQPGHVIFNLRGRADGDKRFGKFEIPRLEFAARLQPLVAGVGSARPEELSALRAQLSSGLGLSLEDSAEE
jgi:hypothetical protein